MPFFSRRQPPAPAGLDDASWLAAGYRHFDEHQGRYTGPPERLVDGGDRALAAGDLAAALFMYARAIDRMQTNYGSNSTSGREFSEGDLVIFDRYRSALEDVLGGHPNAPVATDAHNYNARYTAGMMHSIAMRAAESGVEPRPYEERIDAVCALADISPWW